MKCSLCRKTIWFFQKTGLVKVVPQNVKMTFMAYAKSERRCHEGCAKSYERGLNHGLAVLKLDMDQLERVRELKVESAET